MDNKDKSYRGRGYSENFQRIVEDKKIPYLSSFDMTSYVEGISANLIQGGVITSKDGKLKIDLENSTITYDDGLTTTELI